MRLLRGALRIRGALRMDAPVQQGRLHDQERACDHQEPRHQGETGVEQTLAERRELSLVAGIAMCRRPALLAESLQQVLKPRVQVTPVDQRIDVISLSLRCKQDLHSILMPRSELFGLRLNTAIADSLHQPCMVPFILLGIGDAEVS